MSKLNLSNIRKAHRILLNRFGENEKEHRRGGFTGDIIAGLMSQNTTDKNRDVAFKSLMDRFGTLEKIAKAPIEEIANAISPAGMMNVRAPRIKSLLEAIKDETGDYKADFLLEIPHKQAFEWLIKRDGIGEKTAAVFLLFRADAPYFPVDTHIKRILPRLGWFPNKTQPLKIQHTMTEICPPEIMKDFHLNIIRLGRTICKPRNPKCEQCPLDKFCDYSS